MSTSQIFLADAFYPLFQLLFQVPCTILIQKIGKRNSLIIANICICIYLIFMLGLIGTFTLIIANVFLACGFVIKSMSESNLLYDSIFEKDIDKKREIFSKYEGKSTALYYFFDAISAILAGYMFTYNPYLPMTLSLILAIITVILSINLYEIPVEKIKHSNQTIKNEFKTYLKDLSQAFKYILNSSRLRSLILFNGLFVSILNLTHTLQRSLLNDVNIPPEKFGIIFAVMGIIACLSSISSVSIHNKLHNKTLSTLGITFTVSMIISASVILLNLPSFLMYYILLLMTAIQYFIKGPFYTLIKRYLNSFCDSNMRLKIYSANSFVEFLTYSILSIFCSFILNYLANASATLLFGIIATILMIILVNYMHTRVGLKPEEYSKKDIFFEEVE
jgi:hypothetical protein